MKSFFNGFFSGFKEFNLTIANIVNSVLLALVYFFGAGLTAIVARVFKKHFLDFNKKDSYWAPLNLTRKQTEDYYRQF